MIEFLLDYYVYILIVLGIIIITIIGFLVDSSQKNKKKEQKDTSNEVKTVEPLPESNIENNEINKSIQNEVQQPEIIQEHVLQENLNNVQLQSDINSDQAIALSEQKPHFEPREVVIPSQSQMSTTNENINIKPQPVSAVSINQPLSQQPNFQIPKQQIDNYQTQTLSPVTPNNQVVSNMPINSVQPTSQTVNQMANGQFIASNMSGYNNINNVSQTSNYHNLSNQMPNHYQQQPVGQVSNAPVNQSTTTPVQNSQTVSREPSSQTQPKITTPNIGISFVTGESNLSNENNDNWKL